MAAGAGRPPGSWVPWGASPRAGWAPPASEAPAFSPFQLPKPQQHQHSGSEWVKLGVSCTAPLLLPPHHHPWCWREEGSRLQRGKRSVSEPPETPCVVTRWRNTGLCMQLGHTEEQGPAVAGIDQEEPSQGSPTLGEGVPSGIPALGMVGTGLSKYPPSSSPSQGSACNAVTLEHSLPQQTRAQGGGSWHGAACQTQCVG